MKAFLAAMFLLGFCALAASVEPGQGMQHAFDTAICSMGGIPHGVDRPEPVRTGSVLITSTKPVAAAAQTGAEKTRQRPGALHPRVDEPKRVFPQTPRQ